MGASSSFSKYVLTYGLLGRVDGAVASTARRRRSREVSGYDASQRPVRVRGAQAGAKTGFANLSKNFCASPASSLAKTVVASDAQFDAADLPRHARRVHRLLEGINSSLVGGIRSFTQGLLELF